MSNAINSERINFRIHPDLKEILKIAAQSNGQSMTDFIISTVAEKARSVIQERATVETILLTNAEFDKVVATLEEDIEPNENLKKAFKNARIKQ